MTKQEQTQIRMAVLFNLLQHAAGQQRDPLMMLADADRYARWIIEGRLPTSPVTKLAASS